jgi:hypothetical protein
MDSDEQNKEEEINEREKEINKSMILHCIFRFNKKEKNETKQQFLY